MLTTLVAHSHVCPLASRSYSKGNYSLLYHYIPYRNTLRNLTVLPDTWHCMAKTETESNNSLTFADPPLTWLTDQRMCFYMAFAICKFLKNCVNRLTCIHYTTCAINAQSQCCIKTTPRYLVEAVRFELTGHVTVRQFSRLQP